MSTFAFCSGYHAPVTDPEIVRLRVSIARIAQAAGVPLLSGVAQDATYEALCNIAAHRQHGWNELAARIAGRIANQQKEIAS